MAQVTFTYNDPTLGELELIAEYDYPSERRAGIRWTITGVTHLATMDELDPDEFIGRVEQSSGGYDALGDLVVAAVERPQD